MITYTIEKVDLLNKQVLIKYQKEGCSDWWRRIGLPDNFDDDYLHTLAEEQAQQAAIWWSKTEGVSDNYVVAEPTRQIKEIIHKEAPDYDPLVSDITFEWVEDATTKYKVYSVTEKSAEDKAFQIRERRNQELALSDTFALSDVTMSDEMRNYRQALRDITAQETFPNSVIWPIYPI